MLRYRPAKAEHKVKRKIDTNIGFIGILLTAGILFTMLLLNSNVSSAASASSDASLQSAADTPTHDQALNADTLKAKTKDKRNIITQSDREAAAKRLKEALDAAAAGGVAVQQAVANCSETPNGPHYFGPCPNYATSQLPTVITTGTTPTSIGNPLTGRGYPTDTAANVFVVNTQTPLSNGTLTAFQTYNQPGSGPNTFNAYVLRPTGIPNQYSVIFDSGPLTVPSVTVGQLETFTLVMPINVQTGDLIAHYGQGIPIDIGLGTGMDTVFYPANTAPTIGTTIDVIAGDTTFPLCGAAVCSDRTYSIAATVNIGGATIISGGIMKFVDSLPGLGPANANNLGQYMPIAVPDTMTYNGSDYYEIALVEYREQMHSNLTPTKLRGYVQLETAVVQGSHIALTNPDGSLILKADGSQAIAVDNPHYLGPVIISQKDKPVRIKFYNLLPTSTGGDLFIPVDTTVMGAGDGPKQVGTDANGNPIYEQYKQNRATLHLHGGHTPWISDGTPHQWITPAGENTAYPKGVSVRNVPDMPDPGNGSMTFFYTNNQSARLMFYHDHAYGITRLNVYAGEAAGYLLQDQFEKDLIDGTNLAGANPTNARVIPADQIPLVIQDKTFVPDNTTPITNMWGTFPSQLAFQDPTWNTAKWGGPGDLWLPHIYETLEDPGDIGGINAFGRWPYAPWFWPPATVTHGPVNNPYYDGINPFEPKLNPGTPDPSIVAEAFMDTPVVNGAAYPNLTVEPKAYRFRILNAANDRFFNLQLYQASSIVSGITVENMGSGYISEPAVTITNAPGDTTGHGATATATVDLIPGSPTFGNVTAITLDTVGSNYTAAPIVTITGGGGTGATATATIYTAPTEVGMVPAVLTPGFPAKWPKDGRAGGVPDPATAGPQMIQIGTDGGFLPKPVVLTNQPVDWNMDPGTFDFGIVNTYQLLLGPAQRADVIVDFSQYAGKTLILYNDAPAPNPANDPRLNYYTGDTDKTDTGGAPTTLPGYGPNTRTIMQIRVNNTAPAAQFDLAGLNAAFASTATAPGVFNASQIPVIVPQAEYNSAYNASFPSDPFVRIQDTNITFTPIGSTTPVTLPFEPKAIQDEQGEAYDKEYGRLSGMMGLEMSFTTVPRPPQAFVLLPYGSPPVDIIKPSVHGTQIGTLEDGTQIWSITHNGVDAHPMHWHGMEVQLINRVAWDNNIRQPDLNELGWKETLTLNPLQNTIIAMRPLVLDLPFDVPNSIRLLDVTKPLGATLSGPPLGFQDPAAQPVTILNHPVNFGWEYVWHCHILAHEENDLMHAIGFAVPPKAPSYLVPTVQNSNVVLTWMDNALGETNFTVQRANNATGPWTTLAILPGAAGSGITVKYTDRTYQKKQAPYYYRVIANNVVGDTTVYPAPAVGFPTMTVNSAPSNIAVVNGVQPPIAPSNLTPTSVTRTSVGLAWNDNSADELGFQIQRATNSGFSQGLTTFTVGANVAAFTDTTVVPNTKYYYRVRAFNGNGYSAFSNTIIATTLP